MEERRDEISPTKSSLDHGGEDESTEQQQQRDDDVRNETGDGPMRRDQSLDEDGFIRADQPRRGGAGSGRGSGGGYGPRVCFTPSMFCVTVDDYVLVLCRNIAVGVALLSQPLEVADEYEADVAVVQIGAAILVEVGDIQEISTMETCENPCEK